MDVKESAAKVIKALVEIGEPIPRQTLTDFVQGRKSHAIEEQELDELDTYGIGEAIDEDILAQAIDAAIEAGYIKQKSTRKNELAHTAAGKKFAKKPTPLEIQDGDELGSIDKDRVEDVELDPLEEMMKIDHTSQHTKHQIRLIQAIDRKVALDDFAQTEGLDLDEVLDNLENLVRQGRPIDITYFTDEVMGDDCVDELISFFNDEGTDDLDHAIKEFGDLYNEEELRLARIVYRAKKNK